MGHTKVKTTYSEQGVYGSTATVDLYCHHNLGTDSVAYYDSRGQVQDMAFDDWDSGNDLWDAMQRLWYPFKGEWGGELKDNVEYYSVIQ